MRIGFVTVANGPFLPQAVLLARSIRAQHPNADMVLVWAEIAIAPPDWLCDEFTAVVGSEELVPDSLADMSFRYDIWQFCWAHKPLALRWMLERNGSDLAIFLDSDIRVFAPFYEVLEAATNGADLVLTPHVCNATPHRRPRDDEDLLANGAYNAGMIAVRASDSGRTFVDWYVSVLTDRCLIDRERGLYGDQKWLDMAPSLVEATTVLRQPGYNLAYWNAHQRTLARRNGEWLVSGVPLVFFHMSQFSHYGSNAVGYFSNYFQGAGPNYQRLINEYQFDLTAISVEHDSVGVSASTAPADCVRKAYAAGAPVIHGDHAAVAAGAVDWLNCEVPHRGRFGPFYITRLYDHIWLKRRDIRHNKFDIDTHAGQRRFMRWLVDVGRFEENIPEQFLIPALEMLRADVESAEAGGDRLLSVEEQLAELELVHAVTMASMSEREAELLQVREALAGSEAEISSMMADCSAAEEERARLSEELETRMREHSEQEVELRQVRELLSAGEAERLATENECARLRAELETCARDRTELTESGHAQAVALTNLSAVLKSVRQELLDASALAEQRKGDVEVLSATLGEILHKVGEEEERYVERLAANRSEIAILAANLAAYQAEGKGLNARRVAQ